MTEKILKIAEVCERVGLGRSSIYRGMAEGQFPRQVKLTRGRVGWAESEVSAWVEDRLIDRDFGVGHE